LNTRNHKPLVAKVVFNKVPKRLATPSGIAAAPGIIPFTPPGPAMETIAEIAAHLSEYARCLPERSAFFEDVASLASVDAFMRRYVTAVPAVADSVWQASSHSGCPVVCADGAGEATAVLLESAAGKLLGKV
jgi:hypothetical protein